MASTNQRIASHYGGANLHERIISILADNGVERAEITRDHLKPIDEFHIGGAAATERLLESLEIGSQTRLLDIGSGIGGAARMIAGRYGAQITGIDLTPDYVDTASRLTALTGGDIDFVQGSALDMPFDDASFDVATLLHVGMNIPDKPGLFREVHRVLAENGTFAIYDIMRFGEVPSFPMPWATVAETSFLEMPETYLSAASEAGFRLRARTDRGGVAKDFFARMQEQIAKNGPPPLGLPLLMGEAAPQKMANMIAAVKSGDIQPVEMIFEKT